MTKLYLDLGNTSLKIHHEDGSLMSVVSTLESHWEVAIKELMREYTFRQVIIASVATIEKKKALLDCLGNVPIVMAGFDKGNWVVQHCYEVPGRLGIDRLLAIESAYREVSSSVVVIDCGSAITIDSVNESGQHMGGYIVPGYRLQMQSLLRGTSLTFNDIEPELDLGKDTSECIRNGSLKMIESFCCSVVEQLNPKEVLLTGGDLNGVLSPLASIGKVDDRLVFKGMKYVYG